MGKLKLLIVDENVEVINQLENFFKTKDEFQLLHSCRNGEDALESIYKYKPNIVITELVLSKIDGLEVLEKVHLNRTLETKPQFIVISNIALNGITKKSLEYGACYYILKPFSNDIIYKRILSLIASEESNTTLVRISFYLNLLGITTSNTGFQYLKDAISYCIEKQNINISLVDIYEVLSQNYSVTKKSVEKSIQYSIDNSFRKCQVTEYTKTFGHTIDIDKNKPTAKEFITMIADKIMGELNK